MFESECECQYQCLFLDCKPCNDKYNVGIDNVGCLWFMAMAVSGWGS